MNCIELRRHRIERVGDEASRTLAARDRLASAQPTGRTRTSPESVSERKSVGSRGGRTPRRRRRPDRGPHPRAARRGHDLGVARCASSPAPAPARPASSPAASPGRRPPGPSTRAGSWPSRSPVEPPASCAGAPVRSVFVTTSRPARSTRSHWPILRNHWKDTGRRAPELLERRMSFLARQHRNLDRSSIADIDGEIGWARARLVTPEAVRRCRGQGGQVADPVGAWRSSPTSTASYEEAEAQAQARRLRRHARPLPRHDDPGHSASPTPSAGVIAMCSSTSSRTSTRSSSPCSRAGSAPSRRSSWSAIPNQAIYGWNGAQPELLNEIGEHLPGCAVIHLRTNFRSTPEILRPRRHGCSTSSPSPSARPVGRRAHRLRPARPPTTEAVAIARSVRGPPQAGCPVAPPGRARPHECPAAGGAQRPREGRHPCSLPWRRCAASPARGDGAHRDVARPTPSLSR